MAREVKVDDRIEELDPSCIQNHLDSLDKDTTDCLKNDNMLKEVTDFVDMLLNVCLISAHLPIPSR